MLYNCIVKYQMYFYIDLHISYGKREVKNKNVNLKTIKSFGFLSKLYNYSAITVVNENHLMFPSPHQSPLYVRSKIPPS